VSESLRCPGLRVPEQALHGVEGDATVDQEARKRVAQVVKPKVL
jgi:hypothetical protein